MLFFSYVERRNSAPAFVSSCSNTRNGQHDKLTHHAVYRTSATGRNSPANNSRGRNVHILQQRLIDGKGRLNLSVFMHVTSELVQSLPERLDVQAATLEMQ